MLSMQSCTVRQMLLQSVSGMETDYNLLKLLGKSKHASLELGSSMPCA